MKRTLALGVLALLGALPLAAAADWTFDPSVTLQDYYNDSPLYITQADTQTECSWFASAELELEGKAPRSTYSSLDPIGDDPTLTQSKTKSFRGEPAIVFSPQWHLVFSAELVDQTTDGGDPTLDASYTIPGAGVRWSPLARER